MKPLHTIALTVLLGLELLLVPRQAAAQQFPDGITPNDSYISAARLLQIVDVLLQAKGVEAPPVPEMHETGLGPFHVYQMALTAASRVQEFDLRVGVQPFPTIASSPRLLAPRDVKYVADLLADNLRRAAQKLGVEAQLFTDLPHATEKTPTDVFAVLVEVFVKLDRLCGHDKISHNEVHAQLVRATADVRSILQQGDPASRYRIDAPAAEPDRTPRHVLESALAIRETIKQLSERMDMQPTPLPTGVAAGEVGPDHPFVQTQIIIAELNLLKVHLQTTSSTPLAIPVAGKTPTHVQQQALLMHHLLQQVPKILERMSFGSVDQ